MIRETLHALIACVATFLLCAVAYPLAVWGAAWLAFPRQAGGSLIERDGKVIGSALVAQPFSSDRYFHPRPSAVDYKADATGGSNLGTTNPALHAKVAERAGALGATTENPAPIDLVTASGGGLDPHVSLEGARYQVARVAHARALSEDRVQALIEEHTEHSGALIGAPPRVNVLELNLALDREPAAAYHPRESPSGPANAAHGAAASPSFSPSASAAVPEREAIATRLEEFARHLDALRNKVEAIPPPPPSAGVKVLEERLDRIAEDVAQVSSKLARLEGLDTQIKRAEDTLGTLRTEIGELRNAIKLGWKSADGPTRAPR